MSNLAETSTLQNNPTALAQTQASEALGYMDLRRILDGQVGEKQPILAHIKMAKELLTAMYQESLMKPLELAPWEMGKERTKNEIRPLVETMPVCVIKNWGVHNNYGKCKKVHMALWPGKLLSLPVCMAINRHFLLAAQKHKHKAPKLYAPVVWEFNTEEPFANEMREINKDFAIIERA